MEQYIPISGGTYIHPDKGVSRQLCQNLYPSNVEGGGKVERVLIPSEGYSTWRTMPDNGSTLKKIRCIHYSSTGVNGEQTVYVATANAVYRVTASTTLNGGIFKCGDIPEGSSNIYMNDNGFDLLIVDGALAYSVSLTAPHLTVASTWRVVPLPTISGIPIKPSRVVFSAQRFFIDSGKNQIFYSDLASTTFQQESFVSAESNADYILSMILVSDNILVLGSRSFEYWSIDGEPLQYINGSPSEIGIMAKDSLASIGDFAYWLASSDSGRFSVMSSKGGSPIRISDDGIETVIEGLLQPSGATGFCFYNKGHLFYVLNFVVDKVTLVYDASTQQWHSRVNIHQDTGMTLSWQPSCITSAYNGILLAGSGDTHELFVVSSNIKKHGEQNIVRKWVTPIIWDNLGRFQVRSLQMDISSGTTIYTVDNGEGNVEPKVLCRFSVDNGYTFNDQTERSLGKMGYYGAQPPLWINLGIFRALVGEFIISSDVSFSIRGLKMIHEKAGGI